MSTHSLTLHSSEARKAASLPLSFDSLPDSGYLREAQLIPHILPFSSATLWRGVVAGTFPRPIRLSARVTAWRVGDLRKWLEAKAAGGAQ